MRTEYTANGNFFSWRGSARHRVDIDATWIPGRGRANARRHERVRPWPLLLSALPAIQRRGHSFIESFSGLVCPLCQPPAPERAAQRLSSGLTALRGMESLISCREARWPPCSALCVGFYGGCVVRRSLLNNCPGDFLCVTCCWDSSLVPSALRGWTVFLGKFCVPCPAHVAPRAHFTASEAEASEGRSNMWCPPLEAAYHHSIGGFLTGCMCHRNKAAVSQSWHFALFVNRVARASTDRFFTFCDVHLAQEHDFQATWLQRRHEQFGPRHRSTAVRSVGRREFFRAPHCRRAAARTGLLLARLTTCLRTCTAHSMKPFHYHTIRIYVSDNRETSLAPASSGNSGSSGGRFSSCCGSLSQESVAMASDGVDTM